MALVRFSHPHREHRVGDVAEVDDSLARALVSAGVARYHDEPAPVAPEPPDVSEDDGDDDTTAA